MQQVSISQARQMLSSLVNRTFNGEEFVIVKNKLQVAKLSPIGKASKKKALPKRKILPEATTLLSHWKGSTVEVADKLRKRAWRGNYDH